MSTGTRICVLLVCLSLLVGVYVPAAADMSTPEGKSMTDTLKPAEGPDWIIAIASDLHYIAPGLTDGGAYWQRVLAAGDSKFMPYVEEITDAFLEEMLALRPDALLLTGDLTFNGAVESHEALTAKLRKLTEAGIPVLCLTGNHDVYNLNAACFTGDEATRVPFATTETFGALYASFGMDGAIARDPDSLSYIWPLTDSCRILMLDFNTLQDFCGISENSLAWVAQQLRTAEDAGIRVLAAGHQNLFQHSVFRDGYVVDGADRLAALLRDAGVRLFLSGHLHIQHILTENDLTEITTSALCSYPCQYGILKAENGSWSYETKKLDMAAWAERNGRTEQVFQDFAAAAAEYMTEHFKVTYPSEPGPVDPVSAAQWLQNVNLAFFAGDLREIAKLDPDGLLADAWLRSEGLTAQYVSSLLEESGRDHNLWSGDESEE